MIINSALREFAYAAANMVAPEPDRCASCGQPFTIDSHSRPTYEGSDECTTCERDRHIGEMRRTR